MIQQRWQLLGGLLLAGLAAVVLAEHAATRPVAVDARWSNVDNGLRARLSMRRSSVSNCTGIVTTYLELNNVADMANPLLVNGHPITFKVTDADGREVPVSGIVFDGMSVDVPELVLPHDSSLRFRIGPCGSGIPGNQAALVDLGPTYSWALPRDGKRYYLQGVIEIDKAKNDRAGSSIRWHGRLALPPVRIPTEGEVIDPATVGPLIEDLGAKMLSKDSGLTLTRAT